MRPRMRMDVRTAGRLATIAMIVTATLYALFGGALVYRAYAQQTYSWVIPTLNKPHNLTVPTGSDDASVKAFFDYNALRHAASLQETYANNPYYLGTMYLIIGIFLILTYVVTFAWFARIRGRGDLYPVEVYNGYLTERGGPVDMFNWVTYVILLSYMVVYTVVNLIGGQYY
jgi:hypothetical protein